uniref:Uncharacterized protein n=1 Tax=Parastrongyloides trichosuri TaxID=131310 RepID=A0A0N4ZVR6_PARTI
MQRSQLVYQDTNGVQCNGDFYINFNGSFQCHGKAYPKNDIHLNLKFYHTGGATAELVNQDIDVKNGGFHCQTKFGSSTRRDIYMELTFNHSCCEESQKTNCKNVCEWRLPNGAFSCRESMPSPYKLPMFELSLFNQQLNCNNRYGNSYTYGK